MPDLFAPATISGPYGPHAINRSTPCAVAYNAIASTTLTLQLMDSTTITIAVPPNGLATRTLPSLSNFSVTGGPVVLEIYTPDMYVDPKYLNNVTPEFALQTGGTSTPLTVTVPAGFNWTVYSAGIGETVTSGNGLPQLVIVRQGSSNSWAQSEVLVSTGTTPATSISGFGNVEGTANPLAVLGTYTITTWNAYPILYPTDQLVIQEQSNSGSGRTYYWFIAILQVPL